MIANEPPARMPARSGAALTRRGLFQLGAAGAALAATPLAARGFGSGFTHGVASGEPSQNRVLLWTRYVAEQDVTLQWQVARDLDFTQIVGQGDAQASADTDWCVKSWAVDLEPGQWYYYRFIGPYDSTSEVGRTRTLPAGGTDPFRMAIFSCSNYGFGYFNAYAHAAEANDADLAVHLGDYIYEYARGTYPSEAQAAPGRMLYPEDEIVALADYRLRYATYRSDPDLRRVHQTLPMIAIWDDHESANDSWENGAQNHQPDSEGDWEVRKAAAKRAYREWMPVSDEPYATYEVGDLATLFRLDTRLEGREEQFNLAKILEAAQKPEAAMEALKAFRDGDWMKSDRQLLGARQEAWLAGGLKASQSSGKKWQVLVQQVLMGKLASPPALLEGLSEGAPDYVRRRLTATAMANSAGLPANMDAWDGYPAARDRVLKAALDADANLLVLAGDTHNAWAFELDHEGAKVGVEFGVQSVSSPGLENSLRAISPADMAAASVGHNPQLKWADTSQRGYALLELAEDKAVSEHRFTGDTRARSPKLNATRRVVTHAGSHSIAM